MTLSKAENFHSCPFDLLTGLPVHSVFLPLEILNFLENPKLNAFFSLGQLLIIMANSRDASTEKANQLFFYCVAVKDIFFFFDIFLGSNIMHNFLFRAEAIHLQSNTLLLILPRICHSQSACAFTLVSLPSLTDSLLILAWCAKQQLVAWQSPRQLKASWVRGGMKKEGVN